MAINDAIRLANFASNVGGIGVTLAGNDMWVAGIITATSFVGDGSNITNAGSSLSAASGSQRVVVTSLTSGTMTSAGTDADLTFNSTTNTLSAGIVSATTLSGSISGTAATFTGNITGTAATFTGNVSIAGTLTYEDVTNIDSVGVITAKSGIRVGSGESISPVSGTFTYYGDGSNLTGVEAGSANFVASGTIPNGVPVIVKDDGTVGIVTETTVAASIGSVVEFTASYSTRFGAAYDTVNKKVVVAYRDDGDSDYGKAVVGTISGTSISFGSPVTYASAATDEVAAGYDVASGNIVIAYQDDGNSNKGTAIVGTVSGTSISFGSEVVFNGTAGGTKSRKVLYDSTNEKVVIVYTDNDSAAGYTSKGTAIVGTVSGTSISFGSEVHFDSNKCSEIGAAYIGGGKIVCSYRQHTGANVGTARVLSVSGTSISYGSAAVFASDSTWYTRAAYDSANDRVVICYRDETNSGKGTAIVGTVNTSNDTISFGTEVVFEEGAMNNNDIVYDSTNEKVVIAYQDGGNSDYGTVIEGTVTGTGITFGTPVVFETANTTYTSCAFDSTNGKVAIAYKDNVNHYGKSVVFSPTGPVTNLTTENYIGIAGEAIANGATGKINIVGGVNSGQSGLTTAKTYYVGKTGILTTTADTPSVVAGTSISDTKIKVRL